jgi:hypothetical protein
MPERQLDFFSDIGIGVEYRPSRSSGHALASAELMDDESLIAAIPASTLADAHNLAVEAGRRRLATAVPELADLCRRFAGFGAQRKVCEQAAAIEALAVIGGRDAAPCRFRDDRTGGGAGADLADRDERGCAPRLDSLIGCPAAAAAGRRAIYPS